MFVGSFIQGGGGWQRVEVSHDQTDVLQAAVRYVKEGNWIGGHDDTCEVRVYQHGKLAYDRDVYPLTKVKIPGFTEIRCEQPRAQAWRSPGARERVRAGDQRAVSIVRPEPWGGRRSR